MPFRDSRWMPFTGRRPKGRAEPLQSGVISPRLIARLTSTLAEIQEAEAKRQWSVPAEFSAGVLAVEGKSRSGCLRNSFSCEGETDGDASAREGRCGDTSPLERVTGDQGSREGKALPAPSELLPVPEKSAGNENIFEKAVKETK